MIQQTSKDAYDDVKNSLGNRQRSVLTLLAGVEDMTNTEISNTLNWPINTVTPRVKELRDAGLVEESKKRMCNITKKNVIAWKVVMKDLF